MSGLSLQQLQEFEEGALGGFTASHIASLSPDVTVPALVNIPAETIGSFSIADISILPQHAFAGFSPEQITSLDPEVMSEFSNIDLSYLTSEAVSGLTAEHIENISPAAMSGFSETQIQSLALMLIVVFLQNTSQA